MHIAPSESHPMAHLAQFNWSVSRSNFLCLGNAHGVAKATGETLVLFKRNLLHHRPITNICSNLGHILWEKKNLFFFFQRVMELLNTSVETRKMVNYSRTWWSQVKTWWKLALCGTDVQIVAAWSESRGERLIEPSSSWLPPKFPSG